MMSFTPCHGLPTYSHTDHQETVKWTVMKVFVTHTLKHTSHTERKEVRLAYTVHVHTYNASDIFTYTHTHMQVPWSQNVNRWSAWLSGQTGWVQNIGSHSNATTNCLALRILLVCVCVWEREILTCRVSVVSFTPSVCRTWWLNVRSHACVCVLNVIWPSNTCED